MAIKKAASKKKKIVKTPVKKVVKKVAPKKRVVKKSVKRASSKQHPVIVRFQEFFRFFSTEE